MKPEEITALARELAKELYNDDKSYNTILWCGEEPKERKAEELEYTLRFLLRRYCLVEKSKIQAKYNAANIGATEADSDYCAYIMDELEDLFPDLGKDAEE